MNKYKIGYLPGVFDLFHIGHLNMIRRARERSEYLIVGVLSDELAEHFKGRFPYISFEERKEIISAIKGVDEVIEVNFENTVKMDAWKILRYDAYFSGSDHEKEWEKEREDLRKVGSDIVYLPYTESTSSTMIKDKLRKGRQRVYFFGAGKTGCKMWREVQSSKKMWHWKVEGFLDNSAEKYLTRIDGLPVYKPEDLLMLERDGGYGIIITMKAEREAEEQLKKLGLEKAVMEVLP